LPDCCEQLGSIDFDFDRIAARDNFDLLRLYCWPFDAIRDFSCGVCSAFDGSGLAACEE
jgi:hypothetical protein